MGKLNLDFNVIVTALGALATTLIICELIYHMAKKTKVYDVKDSIVNLFVGHVGTVLMKLGYDALMFAGFVAAYSFTPLDLSSDTWWYWPLALILSDLSYYWYHRSGHEVRLFWGTHCVHHSSEDYNFSTSFRLSWIESSFRWIFWLPLPLLGFDPMSTMIAYYIVRFYQVWLHTRSSKRIPFFDQIFTVPSHHRVHHGTNPQYIDKNYGGCLIIWDKLFGTYEPEGDPVVYGVLKPIETYNPLKINFSEYGALIQDVVNESSWKNKILYLVKKPGWSPNGPSMTEEELFKEKLSMGYGPTN